MNPRLVFSLFVALLAGIVAAGWALAAGWGLIAGFLLYSGVGSTALLTLTLAWPAPPIGLAQGLEEPALA